MNASHALSGLRVRTPLGESDMVFSKIHKTAEIEVPEGVNEDEVEIIGGVCDARGQWDGGVESVVLHAAKKPETKNEGRAEGQGEEVKTTEPQKAEVTNGPQIALTEPPKPKGRGKQHDKPADKPSEASAETNAADKLAEPAVETTTDKPVEKS